MITKVAAHGANAARAAATGSTPRVFLMSNGLTESMLLSTKPAATHKAVITVTWRVGSITGAPTSRLKSSGDHLSCKGAKLTSTMPCTNP